MNVLVIIGSPRKKNTYEFAKKIEEEINKTQKINFSYLFLNEVKLEYCKGCGLCKDEENLCLIKDDIKIVKDKMEKCDGIIISSPVYSNRETALLKNFLDRFHYYHFRPNFLNKPAIVLSTTGFKGLDDVLNYLCFTAKSWGFNLAGKIGVITAYYSRIKFYKKNIDKRIEKISKKFIDLVNNKKQFRPKLIDLLIFKSQKQRIKFMKNKYKRLYDYWQSKGWLNQDYYYKDNISLFNRVLSKFIILNEKNVRF